MDKNQARDLDLILRARAGERNATEELIKKYTPLVRYIVRNYYARFLDFEDLMQEGLIGLLHAIDEYNYERFNIKFSSFAYICIIRKIQNVVKQTNGNKHKTLNDAVSLFSYVNPDENRMILDVVPSTDGVADPARVAEERYMDQRIEELLRAHLSVLEYRVIKMLIEGYSVREIELEIGVNAKIVDNARTRVRLKLKRILDKYGSLLSPRVPKKTRQRKDLYYNFNSLFPSSSFPMRQQGGKR